MGAREQVEQERTRAENARKLVGNGRVSKVVPERTLVAVRSGVVGGLIRGSSATISSPNDASVASFEVNLPFGGSF